MALTPEQENELTAAACSGIDDDIWVYEGCHCHPQLDYERTLVVAKRAVTEAISSYLEGLRS